MCTVSNLGDQFGREFPDRWPNVPVYPQPVPWAEPYPYPTTNPYVKPTPSQIPHPFQPTQDALRECSVCGNTRAHRIHAAFESVERAPEVSKEDLDALRKEIEELKILLLAAKRYDEATGQPDCEMDEKVDLIRRVAEYVGVDVNEVFGSES